MVKQENKATKQQSKPALVSLPALPGTLGTWRPAAPTAAEEQHIGRGREASPRIRLGGAVDRMPGLPVLERNGDQGGAPVGCVDRLDPSRVLLVPMVPCQGAVEDPACPFVSSTSDRILCSGRDIYDMTSASNAALSLPTQRCRESTNNEQD